MQEHRQSVEGNSAHLRAEPRTICKCFNRKELQLKEAVRLRMLSASGVDGSKENGISSEVASKNLVRAATTGKAFWLFT